MKNFSIGWRLCAGLGIITLLATLLGFLAWKNLRDIDVESTGVEMAYMPAVQLSGNMESSISSASAALKDYFASGNENLYTKGMELLQQTREQYTQLETMTKQRVRLSGLRNDVASFKNHMDEFVNVVKDAAESLRTFNEERSSVTAKSSLLVERSAELQSKLLQYSMLLVAERRPINEAQALNTLMARIHNNIIAVRMDELRAQAMNLPELLAPLENMLASIIKDVTELEKLVKTPELSNGCMLLKTLSTDMGNSLERFILTWEHFISMTEMRTTTSAAMLASVQALSATGIEMTSSTAARLSAITATETAKTLSITAVVVVLALLAGVLLARSIIGPMDQCLQFAEVVIGGDLTQSLNLNRRDELGRLANALDAMVQTLNAKIREAGLHSEEANAKAQQALEAMAHAEEATRKAESAKREGMLAAARHLEGAVAVITSASTRLAAQITQSERGAGEQAARVTETATAMEEMNSTVLEVAKNAGAAADVSAATRQKAEAGALVVQHAVDSIRQVQTQSAQLREGMDKLDENAQAISRIMGVISDIADQTNLLALNAAIEAARAGEAGRGFAVVADEVRKLAEKTMASTIDVGNAIAAIQKSAADSVVQVDASVTGIEKATDFANQSGAALKEIVNMVDSTADQVRAIATASEEQSATSDEITRSISQVNTIAGETAKTMAEASDAVSELADQANKLTLLIEDMKRE